MAEFNADLLRRDVDGRTLRIQGTPHQTGAHLSKNFKKVAAAALGMVSAGILIGIFTAGDRREATDGSGQAGRAGANNDMVGQTQPDLDAMQRNARQQAQHDGTAADAASSDNAEHTDAGGSRMPAATTLGNASADRATLPAA